MSDVSVCSKVGDVLYELRSQYTSQPALKDAKNLIREVIQYETKISPDIRSMVAEVVGAMDVLLSSLADPAADHNDLYKDVINKFLTWTNNLGITRFSKRDALMRLIS